MVLYCTMFILQEKLWSVSIFNLSIILIMQSLFNLHLLILITTSHVLERTVWKKFMSSIVLKKKNQHLSHLILHSSEKLYTASKVNGYSRKLVPGCHRKIDSGFETPEELQWQLKGSILCGLVVLSTWNVFLTFKYLVMKQKQYFIIFGERRVRTDA